MALVVDDLGLSFESTAFLRDSLKKFVNQQMQPGDLVAIIRTGAGVGALQQFTTDKRLLNAAIERIRWNPNGRGGISAFAAIERDPSRAIEMVLAECGAKDVVLVTGSVYLVGEVFGWLLSREGRSGLFPEAIT